MTATNPISMATNEHFGYGVRWTDVDGTPYAINDARMQVRASADSETVIVEASVDDGRITIEPVVGTTGGWANVVIPDTVMSTVTYTGSIVYDVLVTRTSDGFVKRVAAGTGTIAQGVTR